jgi:hypothetical protein
MVDISLTSLLHTADSSDAFPNSAHRDRLVRANPLQLVLKSRDAAEVVASFDLRYNDQPHVVAVRDNEQPARVALRFLAQHAIHDVDPHAFAQQVWAYPSHPSRHPQGLSPPVRTSWRLARPKP